MIKDARRDQKTNDAALPSRPAEAMQVRDLRLQFGGGSVPRHWLGGKKSVTTFLDGLSIYFPAGERFFIRSVKAFEPKLTDPQLREAVRLFCLQEAMHTREHVHYNQMLVEQGYPAQRIEKRVTKLLKFFSHAIPLRWQLAATCGLEHYTSVMGQLILRDPRLFQGAHPTMRDLWLWHATEENEHKSVAFDVYQAVGGNNPERLFIMIVTSLIFWTLVWTQQAEMMAADGNALSAKEWRSLFRYLFKDPGGMQELIAMTADYFRLDFHPRDTGGEQHVQAWLRQRGSELFPASRNMA